MCQLEKCHTQKFLDNRKHIEARKISEIIINRLKTDNKRYFANDNISQYINKDEIELLIQEATIKFYSVLKTLVIDVENDPNSQDTAYRLAKMYITELMSGRYEQMPAHTTFPNKEIEGFECEDLSGRYTGMIVVPADLKSICSHHWQPVSIKAYIGIIPHDRMLGLSKYIRIAQWVAKRGTLQEQLCTSITKQIMKITKSEDVGVYLEGHHGCCENRGIMAKSSLTQTSYLHGAFRRPDLKDEFMSNIKLQKMEK